MVDKVELLLEVAEHLDGCGDLLAELEQLLVALLNLLIARLVLNLELLKVDKVQALGQLLALLELHLAHAQHVAQLDVAQPLLPHPAFLLGLGRFKLLERGHRQRLGRLLVHGIARRPPPQLLKLLLHPRQLRLF